MNSPTWETGYSHGFRSRPPDSTNPDYRAGYDAGRADSWVACAFFPLDS